MTKAVDCFDENKRLVPLIKVVKAAIIDSYGDIQSSQQRFLHWASRSFQDLNRQVLKIGGKKVLLTVNQNTKTATLPIDFEVEKFVGYINNFGQKVPFKLNANLADLCNYEEIDGADKCESCGQDKTICDDLVVTEEVKLVVINDQTYENTVIKKLYPNGDYYLETKTYVKDIVTNTVSPIINKEFIANLELKPCGCLETTASNISTIQQYCPETYCNYYSECCNTCQEHTYRIFEDTGLIQFDFNFPYTQIALEYTGFLPKKNGQYMVPEVAFETLVEHVKWRAIKDRKGAERWRILDTWDSYVKARKMMMKVLTRVSLQSIIDASRLTPRFNIDYGSWYGYFGCGTNSLLNGTSGGSSVNSGGNGSGGTGSTGSTIINNYPTTIINNGSYQLAVRTGDGAGHPVNDTDTYQNNLLVNATDVNFILVAKQVYSKVDEDFSFNPTTGTVTLLNGNRFFTPDSLIIPYNKIT